MELYKTFSLFTDVNLKAYYRLEGNANDATANAHNGTDLNATYGTLYGRYGQGITYANGWSVIPDHVHFKPTTNFSVGAWIKTTSIGDERFFVSHYRDSGGQRAGWEIGTTAAGKFYGEMGIAGSGDGDVGNVAKVPTCISSASINDGKWKFCVMTYDGSVQRLYVNGVADGTTNTTITIGYHASNAVRIGADYYVGNPILGFTGSLDEIFIFNGTVLTAANIKTLYISFFISGII